MRKNNRTLVSAFAAALSLAALVPISAAAEGTDVQYASEWVTDENGRRFYYDESGEIVTGEQEIDGEMYLFSKNGVQKTGWRTVDGTRRYYDIETGKAVYGWIDYCGKQYYIDKKSNDKQTDCITENEDGKLVLLNDKGSVMIGTGLTEFEDNFYFVGEDGTLATGEIVIDDMPYIFDDTGKCGTGWQEVSGKKYYYNPEDAKAILGLFELDGSYYYVDKADGMCTSVAEIDGVEYLFNEQTGQMQYGWLDINGNKRYFYKDSTYAKGLTEIDNTLYIFDDKGVILTGLQTVDGKKYYADEQGKAVKGKTAVGDDFYYFGDDYSAQSGIFEESDGSKYLFGEDGIMCRGFADFDGKKYYLDKNSGKVLTGKLLIDNKKYYFADDGSMQFGWATIGEDKYYFTEDGTAASGITEIDGKKYYFNGDTGVMMTGRLLINNIKYFFADDGSMQFGLQEVDGEKYFFDEEGKMVSGWQESEGNKYYFNATSGKMEKNKVIDNTTALAKDGKVVAMSAVQQRAKNIIASTGTNATNIYNYVRNHNRYSYIEATRSLANIEAQGWAYFANYALDNRFVVCYYFAAVTDMLYKQAGYETRIVYGTGTHTTDHYWNQVYVNGQWLNYDTCNGYCGVSDAYLKSLTYTWTKFVYATYY